MAFAVLWAYDRSRINDKWDSRRDDATVNGLFNDVQSATLLAQAIVDTVREPLLVLDGNLKVAAASRSFYQAFRVGSERVVGRSIYDLLEGQFNVSTLHPLLAKVVPDRSIMKDFEISATFADIGERTLLLDARKIFYPENGHETLLLAFEDVTERRAIEREKETLLEQTRELLRQKELLLEEMQHRIANSLQIIASILLLKARAVTSEETREQLEDAHRRVMSVATAQQHIQAAVRADMIEIGPYLSKLCNSLAASMIEDQSVISLKVESDDGGARSSEAVSLGLIVTELVINALKHAFPQVQLNAEVLVRYETFGSNWRLVVSDNGVGNEENARTKGGLGTSIVQALAQQLKAQVEVVSAPTGMSVSITHATFDTQPPSIS
jgi:two-component sensor histidine kinase